MRIVEDLQHSGCDFVVHDHAGGCKRLEWCNGSAANGETSFGVIREPCERFISQHAHMITRRSDATFAAFTPHALLRYLHRDAARCPRGEAGVHCRVGAINARYAADHRVILWPQAFFFGRATSVVCYAAHDLGRRFSMRAAALARCANPNPGA